MAGASESYHEAQESLSERTCDMHRALVSLQEELEAVDWYRQRADAASNAELRDILLHNMREEMEHACMILEWLRRNSTDMEAQMRTYLFTQGPITEVEEEHMNGNPEGDQAAERVPDSKSSARLTVG